MTCKGQPKYNMEKRLLAEEGDRMLSYEEVALSEVRRRRKEIW